MERFIYKELIAWKNSKERKPLILEGARQVGKTWILKEFGRNEYERIAYINCDNNKQMNILFSDFDVSRLIRGFSAISGVTITPGNTLIVLDEVQEVPLALTALKYFQEEAPEYHIAVAGSFLGILLHEGTGFPVGKTDSLTLYPLSFSEFLLANGKTHILTAMNEHRFEELNVILPQCIELLRQYYYTGGMPEVVETYIDTKDFNEVRKVQEALLSAYEQDFSKHAPNNVVPRIRQLWNNIPTQLAKENKKFIYGLVKEGARAREYELALSWLIDCGLVYQVNRVNDCKIPLSAYQDFSAFKLYLLDVGLLCAMAKIDAQTILDGNRIFVEFKGSLTEQYVLTELKSNINSPVFYWSSDKGIAEVDYIVQIAGNNIPIEVKSGENLQSKSLKSFVQKYDTKINVRTSMTNYKKEDWLVNIPLYLIGNITNIINN